MITRFSGTTSVPIADRMAKDCLMHPASGVNLAAAAALAETAVTKGRNRPAFAFYQISKALAEYARKTSARLPNGREVPRRRPFPMPVKIGAKDNPWFSATAGHCRPTTGTRR